MLHPIQTTTIPNASSALTDDALSKRIAMVAEHTTNAAIITDCQSRILWVNPGFTSITGYSLSEVIGKVPGHFLQCEETNEQTVADIRAAIKSAKCFRGELLNRAKNGNTYWLELDIQPIFDESGTHSGFIAIESDISIRKERELVLQEVDEFQNGILDALPTSIVVLDERGIIQHINSNWRSFIAEHDLKQLCSLDCNYLDNIGFLSGPDNHETLAIREGIRQVLCAELKSFRFEFQLLQGETPLWLELTVTPFRRLGSPQLIVAHNDITHRKLAELKLLSSEQKLRSIYESCSDAILLLNESGEILECNELAFQLLGERGTQTLAATQLSRLSPRLQSDGENSQIKFLRNLELAIATGSNRFEWEITTGTGFNVPNEVSLSIVADHSRTLLQCTMRDISERRDAETWLLALQSDLESRVRAEKSLRETTRYLDAYQKIVDHHAIVAETDTAGTIVSVNDAFCRISGYSREELIGQNHRILNSGHHPESMWSQMYKTIANGRHWHGEICNLAKDGTIYWVDTTIAPLYDDARKLRGYFSIRADITSLKLARVAAEAANRSKTEFLANMSHEIRTPMTAILGYTELLGDYLSETHAEGRTREYVQTIKRNGDHLLSIINDILDLSKIEADKMTIEQIAVSPALVVHEVMSLMQVKAKAKGIHLESCATTSIPTNIVGDPTKLRQILVNLVGNAIKFTEVGAVQISVNMHPTNLDQLCFEIRDTGIGLSEEHLSRLFQAFEQVDTSTTRKFGGTGLGLRISKRLAIMLGGDIHVTSTLGQGSTFTVSVATGEIECGMQDIAAANRLLFRGPSVDSTKITAKNSANQNQLTGVRILLAEDGPDNQRLITFFLNKAGAEVKVVENGKLAVEALTSDGTLAGPLLDPLPVDLILMDMQMPEMDGYEATRLLKSKNCAVPILALTAHAMSSQQDKSLEAGCALRLTKPIDRTALIDTCADWGRRVPQLPIAWDIGSLLPTAFHI